MIPNRLCSSYFSVTVLCALSCTIRRIVVLRRPYMAASPVSGKAPKRSRQYISRTTTHRYTHKKEAVRNIIYLWQHDETAVPNYADSTAPLINSCFKSRLLRHLSTSSFQRYLIIGIPLYVCQALPKNFSQFAESPFHNVTILVEKQFSLYDTALVSFLKCKSCIVILSFTENTGFCPP